MLHASWRFSDKVKDEMAESRKSAGSSKEHEASADEDYDDEESEVEVDERATRRASRGQRPAQGLHR